MVKAYPFQDTSHTKTENLQIRKEVKNEGIGREVQTQKTVPERSGEDIKLKQSKSRELTELMI